MKKLVAGAVAAIALVSSACGGGEQSPSEIVYAAASTTADASSSRMTIDMELSGEMADAGVDSIHAEGVFDYDEREGRMTMSLPLGPDQPVSELEVRYLDSVIYQRFPPEMSNVFGGKPWIKIDLDEAAALSGMDLGALASAQSADPTQGLAYLRGVSDDVSEVGEETLRGEDVTHYKLTIDLAKALDEAPDDQKDAIRSAMEQLGTDTTIPAEAWIDDDGRLRKLVQETTVSELGAMKMTMELFDFGVDVDVSEPPASEVTDFGGLFGTMGKSQPQQD